MTSAADIGSNMQQDNKRHELSFRPRARLISILGDHLISNHAVGLIELVKNAYDADATEVSVEIAQIADPDATTVIIADNGSGMTIEDIRLKWAESGSRSQGAGQAQEPKDCPGTPAHRRERCRSVGASAIKCW